MNKYILKYPPQELESPILSKVILETGVPLNILNADIDFNEGLLVVSVVGDKSDEKRVIAALKKYNIEVEKLEKKITHDSNECINCGECIALCPTDAIKFLKDKTVEIDEDKCIYCNACVEACPVRAVKIKEG